MAKRPTYTVYCETCQQHLARIVLGRGFVPYGRKGAEERAREHRHDTLGRHVVTVKEKA